MKLKQEVVIQFLTEVLSVLGTYLTSIANNYSYSVSSIGNNYKISIKVLNNTKNFLLPFSVGSNVIALTADESLKNIIKDKLPIIIKQLLPYYLSKILSL